jgi:selenocysteine lyase/cysteine desulfurase
MHIVYPEEEYPRRERTRARIAEFFSVSPGCIALMRGVSEGYLTVLRGIEWCPGDQVLISGEEEAALLLPTLHLRERQGVETVKFPLVEPVAGQVQAVAERMTDRTRLLAFSHVTTDTGYRLPAREICHLARERGILSFVDTAHSAGLYPIGLDEMGCDYAGVLSYKWMYSPYAAGVLYVRQERVEETGVTYAGGRAEAWLDFRSDRFELKDGAGRFEFGPWSWPLVHTWSCGLDYLSAIGLEEIWDRTVALTQRLKTGLKGLPGVTLLTPESPAVSAALVSFQVAGWDEMVLRDALRTRWNIIIKGFRTTTDGLRASVVFFLLEEEIDLLLEALGTLIEEGPARP